MDMAVIRVTPKQCQVIKSWKKKIHVLSNIFKKERKEEEEEEEEEEKWLYRFRHSKVRNKWAIELQVPLHSSVEKVEDNNDAYHISVRTKYNSKSFSMRHHSVMNTFRTFLIIYYYETNNLHICNTYMPYNNTVFSLTCFGSRLPSTESNTTI